MRALLYLLAGALFGCGLALSGMTDPAKVLGFLDLAGAWDPSLALVMAGALAVSGPGSWLVQRRPAPVLGGSFPPRPSRRIDARLGVGAALFGAGWGLSGFCPGPAVVNLVRFDPLVVGFVVAMLGGMLTARRVAAADR